MKKIFTILFVFLFVLIVGKSFSQSNYDGIVKFNDRARTPAKSVTVKLFDSYGNLFDTKTTDESGKYTFEGLPAGSYNLEISGYTNIKVSMQDSYMLLFRLLGVVNFSPLQELAADINGDGRVNWDDLHAVVNDYFTFGRKHLIGKVVSIQRKVEIGGYTLKSTRGEDDDVGTIGELDGAFEPSTKARNENIELNYTKKMKVNPDQILEVPVYLENQSSIGGFRLSMNYPVNAMSFEQLASTYEGISFAEVNGQIKVSWQNTTIGAKNSNLSEPLFTLKFRTSSSNEIKELSNIIITNESQLIDANGNDLKDVQFKLPSFIGFEGVNVLNNIYPNPVYNSATINYSLSSSYKVSLSVYNTVGQLVANLVNDEQNAGDYEITFNRSNLHLSAGSYIYRLECKGEHPFVQSKMMIVR